MVLPFVSRSPRWLRFLAVSLGLWALGAGAMVLAVLSDAARQGQPVSWARTLAQTVPYFLPLALGTWGVALAFVRSEPPAPARPAWHIVLPALVLFVPLNAAWAALVTLTLRGEPLQAWGRQLASQGLTNTWIDAMLAGGSFAAIAAWSHWRRGRDVEARWLALSAAHDRLRLQLLQGQLEPHFLFNVLNGVSALVRTDDRAAALTALAEVSALLRYALRASRVDRVGLREELDFVRAYLRLQQLRFGDDLDIDWPPHDAALSEWACPPLLLQPLVENAVRHGVEADGGPGALRLRVALDSPEVLTVHLENRAGTGGTGGHGLGLSATRERLALIYGSRATLRAEPAGKRFVVELTLPKEAAPDGLDRADR